ncbi:hypothetical protein V2J09_008991 [Rumex salicifolius]
MHSGGRGSGETRRLLRTRSGRAIGEISYWMSPKHERVVENIQWIEPPANWVKVNSDGAASTSKRAVTGGAIRDKNVDWILGFCLRLGSCTVPMVELWGIFNGLKPARNLRVPKSDHRIRLQANHPSPIRTHLQ